ncbi:MAG: prenyltransferase/squalene oxidase repeat-containing protein [Planctomycetaceae bacterium]
MSEPPSQSLPPDKPTWFRRPSAETGDAEKTAAPRDVAEKKVVSEIAPSPRPVSKAKVSKADARPKRAVANVPQFFLTLNADAVTSPSLLTWQERLRHQWDNNREGFLTSLGLHGLLLLIFALYLLPMSGQGRPAILDVGWTPIPSASQEAIAKPVKIESLIGPVKTTAGVSEAKAKAKEPKADDAKPGPGENAAKPVPVGGALAARTGEGRAVIWQELNIDKSERGIGAGLAWLVRQQEKGGNWKLHEGYPDPGERVIRTDAGATALALLAFLGDGHSPNEGLHAKVVAKGVAFLKSIQKANGDYHDHEELGRQTAFYAHSQATIAMCEAYALTHDPSLKSSCERAIKFLLESQHPRDGGWRYQPQSGESMGDLSVTGWALMALHSARIAKINVPIDNFERATLFLESVSEQNGARYKYQPNDPLEKVSPAMTAEGLLCRQWLGWPKNHPSQRDALAYLLSEANRPTWAPGRRNVYAWYYTAQVLHNVGGPEWQAWYQHTSQLILQNQNPGGGEVGGSWNPNKPPGSNEEYAAKAGRLYLTALSLLVLETPIRHAAIYKPEMKKEK